MNAPADGQFPTTHWTLLARINSADATVAAKALDEVCAQYHYPLYCYIRRRGLDHHDAQDALHDFLARLLRHGALEDADKAKGHLRALLATALQRFLISRHHRTRHERQTDSAEAETENSAAAERYAKEHFTDKDTPDRVFERKWAQEMMRLVLRQLGKDYAASGKNGLFQALKPALINGGSLRGGDAPAIATTLGMSEGALRVAFSRLLRDYRTLLEAEVRQTVPENSEVDPEIAYLAQLFGSR